MMYGLDIGGTKIEIAIFDKHYYRQESWRIDTPKQDYQEFLSAITNMVEEADRKTGVKGTLGIGLPGFIDNNNRVFAANINCINAENFVTDIREKLDRHVCFENDVKSFIFSEANDGAAAGAKSALGLVIGTGFAGGFCLDGKLLTSRQNITTECGHVPISAILQQRYNFPLRQCGCGLVGCIEQYLAGPGVLWMCQHFGSNYTTVPELIKAVENNEKAALVIFNAYIDCLGSSIAGLTLIFDPDVIVLGGGLSNVTALYKQLPSTVAKYLFRGLTPPKIVAPKFGDSSGVRGAALLGQLASVGN